jgi:hypothetical protein
VGQRGLRLLIMDRYLLFDARCGACSRVAAQVGAAARRIDTRPLGDLEMQGLLERGRPGARWQPALVEVDGGSAVRVATGLRLRARLVRILGPVEAWRLWRSAVRAGRQRKREGTPAQDGRLDAATRAAIGAVLVSPELRALRDAVASSRPLDAWWEDESDTHIVTFAARGHLPHERVVAFTVDAGGRIGVAELAIGATADGWVLEHLGAARVPVVGAGASRYDLDSQSIRSLSEA